MSESKELERLFSKRLPDKKLFFYEIIDSTNKKAKEYAAANPSGNESFFVARAQSEGRGRLGRSFSSDEGGLYLSYLTYPDMPSDAVLMLTVYAALAVCETVEAFSGVIPEIKWVNDIFLEEKKLCGILTEGRFGDGGKLDYAVVGIGVNLFRRRFPEELSDVAIALEDASGKKVDYNEFCVALCEKLSRFDPADFSKYINDYRERSLVIGKRITVLSAAGSYEALAVGIGDDGSLTVLPDGEDEPISLFTGEISIRITKPEE